jgi:hypothetical protein
MDVTNQLLLIRIPPTILLFSLPSLEFHRFGPYSDSSNTDIGYCIADGIRRATQFKILARFSSIWCPISFKQLSSKRVYLILSEDLSLGFLSNQSLPSRNGIFAQVNKYLLLQHLPAPGSSIKDHVCTGRIVYLLSDFSRSSCSRSTLAWFVSGAVNPGQ